MPKKKTKTATKTAASKSTDYPWIAEALRGLAEPLERLTVDPQNARTHDDPNVAAIAASLKAFGQRTPIVVNRADSQIEKGNGTYQAALNLGWSHLAVVWVEDDPGTQRGYSIADNRASELAGWDDDLLEAQLAVIEQDAPDLYDELLLDDLRLADEEETDGDGQDEHVPDSFSIVIDCRDEDEQRALFARLKKENRRCRLLTL